MASTHSSDDISTSSTNLTNTTNSEPLPSSPATTVVSSPQKKTSHKYKSLTFVNTTIPTIPSQKIEKRSELVLIIRAFIKYIQFFKIKNVKNRQVLSQIDHHLNQKLFNRYLKDFLNTLNIIGYELPFQQIAYKLKIIISFTGPILGLHEKDKSMNKYRYQAEIKLCFFNKHQHKKYNTNVLNRVLKSYFVHNPNLLNFRRLQLPDDWILNTVQVRTICKELP